MSQLSSIETKLKQLKQGDDRLSEVIDQLLRVTKEISDVQAKVNDALNKLKSLQ